MNQNFVLTSKFFKPYLIRMGEECSIGRDKANGLPIPSAGLSRFHAKIFIDSRNKPFLLDLNSRNGTFLNGAQIKGEVSLTPGDQISVGGVEFYFQEQLEFSDDSMMMGQDDTQIMAPGQLTELQSFLKEKKIEQQENEPSQTIRFQKSSGAMSGNLQDMNITEVLTTLNYFQKTGSLTLRQGELHGEILFQDGEICQAFFGILKHLNAINYILSMKNGLFEFHSKEVLESREIHISVQQILMDYARILDESSEAGDA